nr:unnamed protein product [Callosobruchus analis]
MTVVEESGEDVEKDANFNFVWIARLCLLQAHFTTFDIDSIVSDHQNITRAGTQLSEPTTVAPPCVPIIKTPITSVTVTATAQLARVNETQAKPQVADLHSLEHRRRVAGLSLFYRFYHGSCSSELSQIITPKAVRTKNTREALHAHPYQVEVPTPRTRLLQHSFF